MNNLEHTTIQRCPHDEENPYLQVSRSLIRDNRISPECRWLIIFLLANKDNWKIYVKKLISDLKDHIGKDKIYSLLNEAIEFGYVMREEFFVNGLSRIRYFVSEDAKFKKPQKEKERKSLIMYRLPENPDAETPDAENTDSKERITHKNKQKKESNAHSANATALSEFLLKKITERKPDFTKTVSDKWKKDAQKLLNIRDAKLLRKVIDWVFQDSFWSTIVLSPGSVLKNLDSIELQMLKKSTGGTTSLIEANKSIVGQIKAKFGDHRDITIGNGYIEFDFGPSNHPHIKFEDKGFQEQVENALRKLGLSLL